MTMLLSVRPDHLIISNDKGHIKHVPHDSYNLLKHRDYQGNRIFYKFVSKANELLGEVQETYDPRIFNCDYNGERIQIRGIDNSNDIAQAIMKHNAKKYQEIYKKIFFENNKTELLEALLDKDRAILQRDGSYIIDNVFMVNTHGTASYIDSVKSKKAKWQSLCIVVRNKTANALRDINITTPAGDIKIPSTLVQILAKVRYLLQPTVLYNYSTNGREIKDSGHIDSVVINQLPEWLAKQVIFARLGKKGLSKYKGRGI